MMRRSRLFVTLRRESKVAAVGAPSFKGGESYNKEELQEIVEEQIPHLFP